MLKRPKGSRPYWCLLFSVLLAWVWGQPSQAVAEQADATSASRPNVLLLLADDLGYGELGCQGNPQIPTPHIDALAHNGIRCTQAYVTAPNCSPSRAGLFSGRISTRFGYEFNPIGARNDDVGVGIPLTESMLAEQLRDAGYATGLIGKWHLGGTADFHPLRRGFDEFFGFLHEGHFYVPSPWRNVTTQLRRLTLPVEGQTVYQASPTLVYSTHMGHNEPAYDANNPILRGGQPVQESEYLTDAFTREACDFIQRHAGQPFFLCVAYNAVHSPLQAKNETLAKFDFIPELQRRIFAAMLSDMDSSVGAITKTLDEFDLSRNTLIFFLSDNGGPTRELTSSNSPLRDGKGSMYDGGLRVPFIIRWPARLSAGKVCHEVISSLDIMPTLAGVCGLPPHAELDGQDLLPLLRGESSTGHRQLYWRQGSRAALRRGDWKIVSPRQIQGTREWELYHIADDHSESNDLAGSHAGKLQELLDIWETYDAQMSPPLMRAK